MTDSVKYGLPESDWESVVSILQGNQEINKAVLFGSRAKGTFSNGSDVDIVLFGNHLNLNDIIDISNQIDQLYLPWKFDIILFNRINETKLVEHIRRVGVSLFEKESYKA